MRLIDADMLREKMYHEAMEKDSQDQRWDSGCWIRYRMFENIVDSIPTIDVIQPAQKMVLSENDLITIREWLKDNIFRNETVMYDDNIRRDDIDLVDVIASLYEILHRVVMQEPYEYMFHWANKVGSWCEDQLFINLIKEKMK